MIAFVKGFLEDIVEGQMIIDVNGIGYAVYVPARLIDGDDEFMYTKGEEICLYTHMQVREDDVSLFGFADRDELKLFKQLITVSGIGPKGALMILSTLGKDDLRMAIMADDAKAVAKAPGIGLKTAQKMILELKDKIDYADLYGDLASHTSAQTSAKKVASDARSLQKSDSVMALTALGYSETDALRAVRKAMEDENLSDSSAIIKAALKYMI